jgi:hypothetical protein
MIVVMARPAMLAALALVFRAFPAFAAEGDVREARPQESSRVTLSVPSVRAPRVDQVLDSIHRLRLHPARDAFDISETARRHPHPATD